MQSALMGKPSIPFRVPKGIRLVRVNPTTGKRTRPGDKYVILEAFKAGTEPETIMESGARSPHKGPLLIENSISPLGEVNGLY